MLSCTCSNGSTNRNSENSFVIFLLYSNNKTYSYTDTYHKHRNRNNCNHLRITQQTDNATEQWSHSDTKQSFSKGFAVG